MSKSINIPYIEIGNRIKEFAKSKYGGLSNLSKVMKVSLQTLSQYVNGRNAPGKKLLLKLNKAGCDLNWLLTGKKIEYTAKTFNSLVHKNFELFSGLSEVEKLKHENEELKKQVDRLEAKYKKERNKILKLLQQK